jgi:hypothetical protein
MPAVWLLAELWTRKIKLGCIKVLLTNCPEKVANVSNVGRLGKSDHVMILIEVEKERKLQTEKQIGLNEEGQV